MKKQKLNKSNSVSVATKDQSPDCVYQTIYLGVDLHKNSIVVCRIIDGARAQACQRFSWDEFMEFARTQVTQARNVYALYEAGAFGFGLCRRLEAVGVQAYVCHPEKLDPRHKRVQTDRLDAAHLADKLQRYVRGNPRAFSRVYVPSVKEEHARLASRQRNWLHKDLQRLKARGRGLLLSQGIAETSFWWHPARWKELQVQAPQLTPMLSDLKVLIEQYEKLHKTVAKTLVQSAPKTLPVGFGPLTYVLLTRALCNFNRFKNRRQVGGFTGLCGAVSSSGNYHLDLSINKSGDPELRALLVELAWRMIYYQPNYTGLRVWNKIGGAQAKIRRRKIAVVALARQLMVDIWRWQTGRVSLEQLGLKVNQPTA